MKILTLTALLVLTGLGGHARAADTPPTLTFQSLSAEVANDMVVAALADCDRRGYKVAAAVVGRDGNLLALLRNPMAGPHTVEVSQRKAYSSATFQVSTSSMAERSDLSFAPGVLLIVGAIPIEVGGKFYGGIGVSGADPADDERCALAGLEAVRDTLEFAD